AQGENAAAVARIPTVDWSAYPYTVMLVPGEGAPQLATRVEPAGKVLGEIGYRVEIGANSCVDRAALGVTSVGDGTKLDNLVHVGHNCRIGRHVVVAAQTGFSGGVVVEDYAVIGGQVGIGEET